MEKGKFKRYLLIAAVVAIWGIVVYRIVDFLTEKEEFVPAQMAAQQKPILADTTKADYTLLLNYPDPFLEHYPVALPALEEEYVEQVPQPTVEWPNIRYIGFMEYNNKTLAILEINNHTHQAEKGATIEGIKIQNISPDSLVLHFHNEKRSYKR